MIGPDGEAAARRPPVLGFAVTWQAGERQEGKGQEESSFFEKKEAKKLLSIDLGGLAGMGLSRRGLMASPSLSAGARCVETGRSTGRSQMEKSFFASFFSKKEDSCPRLTALRAKEAREDSSFFEKKEAKKRLSIGLGGLAAVGLSRRVLTASPSLSGGARLVERERGPMKKSFFASFFPKKEDSSLAYTSS